MMNKFIFSGNYINETTKGDYMETLQKIALVFTVIGALNKTEARYNPEFSFFINYFFVIFTFTFFVLTTYSTFTSSPVTSTSTSCVPSP